jgi:hypothetical protein
VFARVIFYPSVSDARKIEAAARRAKLSISEFVGKTVMSTLQKETLDRKKKRKDASI